jgi:hypothetical protein
MVEVTRSGNELMRKTIDHLPRQARDPQTHRRRKILRRRRLYSAGHDGLQSICRQHHFGRARYPAPAAPRLVLDSDSTASARLLRSSSERVCGANGADLGRFMQRMSSHFLFHIHFHDVRSKTKHRVSHSLHAESIGGSW